VVFAEFAKKIEVNPNILIAQIDTSTNSLSEKTEHLPSFSFFRKGERNIMPVSSQYTLKDFTSFAKSKTSFKWVYLEEVTF
jgi:hypothetical protein